MKDEVKNWIKQAQSDLESAEKTLEIKKFYVSAFLSQQAVEKALKAYIINEKGELIKTHSVSKLSREAKVPKEFLAKISNLEPIYQETRYPDVSAKIPAEEFEEQDAVELYNIAEEVLQWVEKNLK